MTNVIGIAEGFPDHIQSRINARRALRKQLLPQIGGDFASLVFQELKLWQTGTLKVSFKNGSSSLHQQIANVANTWTQYANISFDFGQPGQPCRKWKPGDDSHIRVGFEYQGYWSTVGTDSKDPQILPDGEISLNLQDFHHQLPNGWEGIVLHEFGHALGFSHEHMTPAADCNFDWEKVYAALGGPPNYWSPEKVDRNLRQISGAGIIYGPHDRKSIMHYEFPSWMFVDGSNSPCCTERNIKLSAEDIRMAGRAYPFSKKEFANLLVKRKENLKTLLENITAGQQELLPHFAQHLNYLNNDRSFLAFFDDRTVPVELRVKKRILVAAGDGNGNPDQLSDDIELSNMLPTDAAFFFLADSLSELVKDYNPDAWVSKQNVEDAETVGGCVEMVNGKIS